MYSYMTVHVHTYLPMLNSFSPGQLLPPDRQRVEDICEFSLTGFSWYYTYPLTTVLCLKFAEQNIMWWLFSKMNFSRWDPLGMFWSCRTRITGWSNTWVDWTDAIAFRYTWEHRQQICQDIKDPVTTRWTSGNAGNKPGSTWKCWQKLWNHLGILQITGERSRKSELLLRSTTGESAYHCYYWL